MTPDAAHDEALRVARSLLEPIAARAARHDADGTFPVESLVELKASRLPELLVPIESGGLGAGFATTTEVLEVLASADPSLALGFSMHCAIIGAAAELPLRNPVGARLRRMAAARARLFDLVVGRRWILASAVSEPGVGQRLERLATRFERTAEGYRLDGTKVPVSMASVADAFVVAARAEGIVAWFLVERDTEGVEIVQTWDVLGLRSSDSQTVALRGCIVPEGALHLGVPGMPADAVAASPHWVAGGTTGVALGVAAALLEALRSELRAKGAAADPTVQREVAVLAVAVLGARALALSSARQVDSRVDPQAAIVAVHAAKYAAAEVAARVAAEAIRLGGVTAMRRGHPLERHYRDARAFSLLPATSAECLRVVGRAALTD